MFDVLLFRSRCFRFHARSMWLFAPTLGVGFPLSHSSPIFAPIPVRVAACSLLTALWSSGLLLRPLVPRLVVTRIRVLPNLVLPPFSPASPLLLVCGRLVVGPVYVLPTLRVVASSFETPPYAPRGRTCLGSRGNCGIESRDALRVPCIPSILWVCPFRWRSVTHSLLG